MTTNESPYSYTVWVGAVEVTDHYLNLNEAILVANLYQADGYDDVCIEKLR